jgi:integrase
MRATRFPGVYQRCTSSCPSRCRTHRFAYHVELGADHTGRRRQATKSGFATAHQAQQARHDLLQQHRHGMLPSTRNLTVGQWLEIWYAAKLATENLRPTTARSYRHHLDAYLLPHLGRLRLGELRPAHVTAMYTAIRRERQAAIRTAERAEQAVNVHAAAASRVRRPKSFGPASVARLHATLHAALNAAIRAGEVGRNVAELAEWPRYHRPRVRPWQPAMFGVFRDQIDGERLAALFHLAGHAGLRRGELCGLRWQDVDLDGRMLVVRQQVVQVGHRVVVGKPKTASGEDRPGDLDAGTVGVLLAWKWRQAAERLRAGPAWQDSGLVFTRPDGSGWHPQQVTKRFRQLTTAAGLPGCRLHDLRHLSASLQLAAGVDIAVVSKRLGHSALSFTSRLSHFMLLRRPRLAGLGGFLLGWARPVDLADIGRR